MKTLVLIIGVLFVFFTSGCKSSSSESQSQVSLRSGRHYRISNVETGWTSSSSLMLPYIEFDIVNNGTEDVRALTVCVQFWAPKTTFGDPQRLGQEEQTVLSNFNSGNRKHYRFVCDSGYALQDGTWDNIISRQFSPAAVQVGVMFSNETRVSRENTHEYTISD